MLSIWKLKYRAEGTSKDSKSYWKEDNKLTLNEDENQEEKDKFEIELSVSSIKNNLQNSDNSNCISNKYLLR